MDSDFVDAWLQHHPDSLSEADQEELRRFATDAATVFAGREPLGDRLDEIRLSGDAQCPVVAVVFHPGWAENVRWSFEWRLRDCNRPVCGHSVLHPLSVMLVDHVGSPILESLETSLPQWEPDAEGVIHVNVTSEAFWG
jgi:hypothetical protein